MSIRIGCIILIAVLGLSIHTTKAQDFKRADSNTDGSVDIADVIYTLAFVLTLGPPSSCPDAMDMNDNGTLIGIQDFAETLAYLFVGDPPPPLPGPDTCGPDPTADGLGACVYPAPACGTPILLPNPDYELTIDAPSNVNGTGGGTESFTATINLTQAATDVPALSFGIVASPIDTCSIILIERSPLLSIVNNGSDVHFTGEEVVGSQGAFGSVIVDYALIHHFQAAELPYELFEITVEATIPPADCQTCTLELVHNVIESSSGGPLVGLVVSDTTGLQIRPTASPVDMSICAKAGPVPTLSQWGLLIMGLLCLACGTLVLARRSSPSYASKICS